MWRVWLLFAAFTAALLGVLYVNQILLLPFSYANTQMTEIRELARELKTEWNTDKFLSRYTEVIKSGSIKIKVYDFAGAEHVDLIYNQESYDDLAELFGKEITPSSDEVLSALETSGKVYEVRGYSSTERSFLANYACVFNETKSENENQNAKPEACILVAGYIEPIGGALDVMKTQFKTDAVALVAIAFAMSMSLAFAVSEPVNKLSASAKKIISNKLKPETTTWGFKEVQGVAEHFGDAAKQIIEKENLRKDLIANVTHDLKTPLAIVKSYAEMIRDLTGDNKEKRDKQLEVIITEADRLTSMVNDIVELSKLESVGSASQLDMKDYDLSAQAKAVAARFEDFAAEKKIKLSSEISPGISISADYEKIERVIYNFLNNALKYTREGGEIKLTLSKTENGFRFEVQDNGVGISAEELPFVWDKYYKANKSENHRRKIEGTGLGLAIVKRILIAHDLAFGVQSEVGNGSKFWFATKPAKQ